MNQDFLSQLREKAQQGIARRLFADADKTDAELRLLGSEIASKCGAIPVFGPIKQQGRSAEKVRGDYGGDWYELKDAVRMTIVAPTLNSLKKVQALIRVHCTAHHGLGLVKDTEVFAHSSACGFSGLSFVISLSNGRPAEIQANIPEVMYGQMSEKAFFETIGAQKFHEIKNRYGVEGGLGHGLYEIYRIEPASVKGRQAALLSKAYFDLLRGNPDWKVSQELQRELSAFVRGNPHVFHR